MTSTVLLACEGIGKTFGRRWALRDFSLQLQGGEIYGLCGPNGAGKTTLLKILCGLVFPSKGKVHLDGGEATGRNGTGPTLGVVPENPSFIPEFSGLRNLRLLAGIQGRISQEVMRQALCRVGLDPADRRPVRQYSLGMKQRLGLAQALMESPDILLLDEPTNGLDPLGIREMQSLIQEEAARGAAVLMASHLLTVVERVCHRVGIIKAGRLVKELIPGSAQGTVRLVLSTEEDWRRLVGWAGPDATQRDEGPVPGGLLFTESPVPQVIRQLVAQEISIEAAYPGMSSLEDAFLELIVGGSSA